MNYKMNNKTKIQITGSNLTDMQLALRCKRIYGLRNASKIGDTEIVNNTVLGKLQRNKLDIQIKILTT